MQANAHADDGSAAAETAEQAALNDFDVIIAQEFTTAAGRQIKATQLNRKFARKIDSAQDGEAILGWCKDVDSVAFRTKQWMDFIFCSFVFTLMRAYVMKSQQDKLLSKLGGSWFEMEIGCNTFTGLPLRLFFSLKNPLRFHVEGFSSAFVLRFIREVLKPAYQELCHKFPDQTSHCPANFHPERLDVHMMIFDRHMPAFAEIFQTRVATWCSAAENGIDDWYFGAYVHGTKSLAVKAERLSNVSSEPERVVLTCRDPNELCEREFMRQHLVKLGICVQNEVAHEQQELQVHFGTEATATCGKIVTCKIDEIHSKRATCRHYPNFNCCALGGFSIRKIYDPTRPEMIYCSNYLLSWHNVQNPLSANIIYPLASGDLRLAREYQNLKQFRLESRGHVLDVLHQVQQLPVYPKTRWEEVLSFPNSRAAITYWEQEGHVHQLTHMAQRLIEAGAVHVVEDLSTHIDQCLGPEMRLLETCVGRNDDDDDDDEPLTFIDSRLLYKTHLASLKLELFTCPSSHLLQKARRVLTLVNASDDVRVRLRALHMYKFWYDSRGMLLWRDLRLNDLTPEQIAQLPEPCDNSIDAANLPVGLKLVFKLLVQLAHGNFFAAAAAAAAAGNDDDVTQWTKTCLHLVAQAVLVYQGKIKLSDRASSLASLDVCIEKLNVHFTECGAINVDEAISAMLQPNTRLGLLLLGSLPQGRVVDDDRERKRAALATALEGKLLHFPSHLLHDDKKKRRRGPAPIADNPRQEDEKESRVEFICSDEAALNFAKKSCEKYRDAPDIPLLPGCQGSELVQKLGMPLKELLRLCVARVTSRQQHLDDDDDQDDNDDLQQQQQQQQQHNVEEEEEEEEEEEDKNEDREHLDDDGKNRKPWSDAERTIFLTSFSPADLQRLRDFGAKRREHFAGLNQNKSPPRLSKNVYKNARAALIRAGHFKSQASCYDQIRTLSKMSMQRLVDLAENHNTARAFFQLYSKLDAAATATTKAADSTTPARHCESWTLDNVRQAAKYLARHCLEVVVEVTREIASGREHVEKDERLERMAQHPSTEGLFKRMRKYFGNERTESAYQWAAGAIAVLPPHEMQSLLQLDHDEAAALYRRWTMSDPKYANGQWVRKIYDKEMK